MLHFAETTPMLWTGGTASAICAATNVRNVTGWTFPDGTIGDGVSGATTPIAEIWIATEQRVT